MIHVKENFSDENTVTIDVAGVLDQRAVPVLKSVCESRLGEGKDVVLNLEEVVHITREGRSFIREMKGLVETANLPEFMRIES
jgi:ferritin-like metal-binding protein YciE